MRLPKWPMFSVILMLVSITGRVPPQYLSGDAKRLYDIPLHSEPLLIAALLCAAACDEWPSLLPCTRWERSSSVVGRFRFRCSQPFWSVRSCPDTMPEANVLKNSREHRGESR